jgi:hypothetical protein
VETWISKRIRAVALRRLLASAATVLVTFFVAGSNSRYLDNFLNGPYPLGRAELDAITDVTAEPRYYARVSGEKVIDTGIREYTIQTSAGEETSRRETAAYDVLVVDGDRFLFIKRSTEVAMSRSAEGALVPLPDDLEQQFIDNPNLQGTRERFYSFYVSDASFRTPGFIAVAVGLGLFALLLWRGFPAWRAFRDPEGHPLAARVAAWGNPLGVAVEAEREYDSPRFKGGAWRIGEKYLIHSSPFTFDVLRLEDLLWAYKKITKHSVNFIPTGKTYEAVLACYGGTATIQSKEARVDEMLAFANQRTPWAVMGHSDELATLFAKQTQEFASAVEARRQDWQKSSGKM